MADLEKIEAWTNEEPVDIGLWENQSVGDHAYCYISTTVPT
jgi:hypothetical protein